MTLFFCDNFESKVKITAKDISSEFLSTDRLKINPVQIRCDLQQSDTYSMVLPKEKPKLYDKLQVVVVDGDEYHLAWNKSKWMRDIFVEHFWVNYPWWNQLNSSKIQFADFNNLPQNIREKDKYLGICEVLPGGFFKIPTIDFSASLNNINPLVITFRVKTKDLHKFIDYDSPVKNVGDICQKAENGNLKTYVFTGSNWKQIVPTVSDGISDITIGKAFFGIFGIAGFTFDVAGGLTNSQTKLQNTEYLDDRLPFTTVTATGSNVHYQVPAEFVNLNIVLDGNKITLKINDFVISEFDQSFAIQPNLIGKINLNSNLIEEIGGATDSIHFYVDLVKVSEIANYNDDDDVNING